MYNVAILDDDVQALNITTSVIENFFKTKGVVSSIKHFSSSLILLASAKENKYELTFLDIDLPEVNGIEVGKKLIALYPDITIIFLSQREDLVFDCLTLHPFGFIRKSKFLQDFALVMDQFYNANIAIQNNEDRIDFIKKNNVYSFKISEIIYIEGNRNYQEFHLKDGRKESIRISLNELENNLMNKGFIRVQKGYLVNYLFIRSITNTHVILLNGNTIPVSKKRHDEIIDQYLSISRDNNLMMKIENN